jgi:hypothetical protein
MLMQGRLKMKQHAKHFQFGGQTGGALTVTKNVQFGSMKDYCSV